ARAALPEFDDRRRNPVPAPARRPRHRPAHEALLELTKPGRQFFTVRQNFTLLRRPGTELAIERPGAEIGIRLSGGRFGRQSLNPDLALQLRPEQDERGPRVGR